MNKGTTAALIVGGLSALGCYMLYKSSTKKQVWETLPSCGEVPTGRSSHIIGVYKNKLYVWGGENSPRQPLPNAMYAYCLTNKTWTIASPASEGSNVPSGRVGFGGCMTKEGKFYVHGGRSGVSHSQGTCKDMWVFDANTCAWTEIAQEGECPPARSYHVMDAIGTKLMMFGGCDDEEVCGRLNDLWVFDTSSNKWSCLNKNEYLPADQPKCDDAKPRGRGGPCLSALSDTSALVCFGFAGEETDDVWVFTSEGEWQRQKCSGDIPSARSVTMTLPVGDGKYVVFGGERDPSAQGHEGAGEYHSDTYILDVNTMNWTCVQKWDDESSPMKRGWMCGAANPDKREVYVMGGFDGDIRRNDIIAYKY